MYVCCYVSLWVVVVVVFVSVIIRVIWVLCLSLWGCCSCCMGGGLGVVWVLGVCGLG